MRVAALVFASVLVLSSSSASASSYVKRDSSVVDPILITSIAGGGVHP